MDDIALSIRPIVISKRLFFERYQRLKVVAADINLLNACPLQRIVPIKVEVKLGRYFVGVVKLSDFEPVQSIFKYIS